MRATRALNNIYKLSKIIHAALNALGLLTQQFRSHTYPFNSSTMPLMTSSSPNPVMTTLTPRLARARAQARPIPLVDPVTRAVLFCTLIVCLVSRQRTVQRRGSAAVLLIYYKCSACHILMNEYYYYYYY